jgi:predicted PurR-regulated permease PerM
MEKTSLDITWASIARFSIVAIGVAALYFLRGYIALFLSAAVIAAAVEAPASLLMKRKWPRFASVTLVYLSGLAAFFGILYFVVPVLAAQVEDTLQSLLTVAQHLRLPFFPSVPELIFQHIPDALSSIGKNAGYAFSFFTGIVGGLLNAVLVLVVSYYLALQEGWVEKTIRVLAPVRYEEYLLALWKRSERKIGKWFYAQIILSVVVATPVFLGLQFLGVPYALLLAIIAGALEIVPMAGPIISGLIAFVVAVQQGLNLGLYTILLFVLVQQIENHVFVPLLMRRSIGLNPVVIIFSLLVGGALAGFWGIVIAVPVAAAASEFFLDLEKRRGT